MNRRQFLKTSSSVGLMALLPTLPKVPHSKGAQLEVFISLPENMPAAKYQQLQHHWMNPNKYQALKSKLVAHGLLHPEIATTYDLDKNQLHHVFTFSDDDAARQFFDHMLTFCDFDFKARESFGIRGQSLLNGRTLYISENQQLRIA